MNKTNDYNPQAAYQRRMQVVFDYIAEQNAAVTIATPNAVITIFQSVVDDVVATESNLYAIVGSMRKIIAVHQVIIASAFSRIHSLLTGPQEKTIAAMSRRIVSENIVAALFVHEQAGGVLSAMIHAVTVAADVPVEPVVHHPVARRAVQADAQAGVVLDAVVVKLSVAAIDQ